ncbi:MAG: tetratricopeptide repeat protein [Zoogloeaceae bacterium]|jgi:Tfp pilus assembly protein PilF|nr:tetratricopeptide repeat protein [Zoogloeaceae bacterium]
MNALLRRPLLMALTLTVSVALIYGGWLLWQMQRLGSQRVVTAFSPPSSPSLPSPQLPAAAETTASPITAPLAVRQSIAAPQPAPAIDVAPDEESGKTDIVFIAHASPEPRSTPLQTAQAALLRGDVEAARQQFFALLDTDPHHLDALLGLATLALHQNEPDAAWRFYQTAWAAHPQDARVQAGMLALLSAAGQIDAQQAESRLKNLIARQPQAAAPHFALGNLFAGQGRWREAQAAYFEACRQDAGNPDYRFNLAVSLDALHQPELAATHYRAALAATETVSASFAPADVRARLQALQTLTAEAAP